MLNKIKKEINDLEIFNQNCNPDRVKIVIETLNESINILQNRDQLWSNEEIERLILAENDPLRKDDESCELFYTAVRDIQISIVNYFSSGE